MITTLSYFYQILKLKILVMELHYRVAIIKLVQLQKYVFNQLDLEIKKIIVIWYF